MAVAFNCQLPPRVAPVGADEIAPTPIPTPTPTPSAGAIRIQAEEYSTDDFSDSDAENTGGNGDPTRENLAVDIGETGDGGLNVGWIQAGEHLTYPVTIPELGEYKLIARVASGSSSSKRMKASIAGEEITVSFPGTNGWQAWEIIEASENFTLDAGSYTLRIDMLSSGFNIDYLELMPV